MDNVFFVFCFILFFLIFSKFYFYLNKKNKEKKNYFSLILLTMLVIIDEHPIFDCMKRLSHIKALDRICNDKS